MSKVSKISGFSKMVRNDIIKQFLRKNIIKIENGLFMSKYQNLPKRKEILKTLRQSIKSSKKEN